MNMNMKTFVFLACLLTVAYAHDPGKVKAFYQTYGECATELGIPSGQMDAKAMKCVGEKENMYDEQDVINKDKLFSYAEKLFITGSEESGKAILSKCFNEGYQGPGNNNEKAIASIECSFKQNIMDLIAKPE